MKAKTCCVCGITLKEGKDFRRGKNHYCKICDDTQEQFKRYKQIKREQTK